MKEITIFEAEDGKRFDNIVDCEAYEDKLQASDEALSLCRVWDFAFQPMRISRKGLGWLESAYYIYAPTEEAREAINYYCEKRGFVHYFSDSTKDSTYIAFDDASDTFYDMEKEILDLNEKKRLMAQEQ